MVLGIRILKHIKVFFLSRVLLSVKMLAGWCCWFGKELGLNGVYFCWLTAISNFGILGGMEHGKSGRDSAIIHTRVSFKMRSIELAAYQMLIA